MTDEERSRRMTQVLAQESHNQERWFYLSFGDEQQFLGAAIVKARGPASAIQKTHALGINPGGAVLTLEIRPESPLPPKQDINRLLSKQELETIFGGVERVDDRTVPDLL